MESTSAVCAAQRTLKTKYGEVPEPNIENRSLLKLYAKEGEETDDIALGNRGIGNSFFHLLD